jgi:phosphoribosylformimino-5-aminoimidazole carboxamide ribonucleotide (ProFAR) isomerase
MQVIPSIDVAEGRSRLVFWPGAATGTGTPTDRPERIARYFVELGADQIRLLFAAGATRVVMPLLAVAEDPEVLRACLDVAGSWLAVGLDPRPDRLREYRWRGGATPTVTQLVARLAAAGVERFVLSHVGAEPDPALLASLTAAAEAEFLVAGGVTSLEGIRRLAGTGLTGVILGETLLSGRVDYPAAVDAAFAAS